MVNDMLAVRIAVIAMTVLVIAGALIGLWLVADMFENPDKSRDWTEVLMRCAAVIVLPMCGVTIGIIIGAICLGFFALGHVHRMRRTGWKRYEKAYRDLLKRKAEEIRRRQQATPPEPPSSSAT